MLAMQVVGGGNDHGVDGVIGEYGLDMAIDVGDVVLLGDALSQGSVAVSDGDYGTVRKHLKGL
jgi:hypothetical protein